jgi:hypothetical protein
MEKSSFYHILLAYSHAGRRTSRKTVKELSRWTPSHITEWRFRRLLKASYWSIHLLVTWFAYEVMESFPPPEDVTLDLSGDGSHKDKRGKKNPTVQKGQKEKRCHHI